MRYVRSRIAISVGALVAACGPALSQALPASAAQDAAESGVFQLGEISVIGTDRTKGGTSGQALSQDRATAQDMYVFNRASLDDALTLVPGVHVDGFGDSRNEKVAYIRGFDLFQAPLSIDGVRVYLPYDNRLDLGRFITPDLAAVEVQKGYVSVLNGPGGMGGAINLVTRKPTKALDFTAQETIDLGNTGKLAAHVGAASLGTLQEKFYLQANAGYRSSDGFFLSRKFDPVSFGGVETENGGRRDHAETRDWRVNLKAGFTPNDTDEYSISYTKQEGRKEAPFSTREPIRGVTGPAPTGTPGFQRSWEWPKWDYESVYFLSHTALGDKSYVDGKLFYNKLNNLLSAYDDGTFATRTTGRSFDSYYDETGYGGSVELGTELIPMNTLKGAFHWRRDVHEPRNLASPGVNTVFDAEAEQSENTMSFAVENTFHATERLNLVAGLSYDRRDLDKAEYVVGSGATSSLREYDKKDDDAWNWQAAAIYKLSDAGRVHASVSDRTRFPTLWERFSTRFGDALPNPGLKAERAQNWELGWTDMVRPGLTLGATVFYSDVKDVIQGVGRDLDGDGINEFVQNRNVGDGDYYGVELKAEWAANETLTFGGHYAFLHRKIDGPDGANIKPVGTPKHSAFVYAKWEAYAGLVLTPSLELSSSRYSSDRFESAYTKNGGFALVNMSADYKFTENFSAGVGVRNLFDRNYAVQYGYPEAGRTLFMRAKATF